MITKGDAYAGATFSEDEVHRYHIWRVWDHSKPLLGGCFLNPSKADHMRSDPTITRWIRRAKDMGFGGILNCNAFALRSTDPKALYSAVDPVGPENDKAILRMAKEVKMIVVGWGNHGALRGRGCEIIELLRLNGYPIHCLGVTKGGHPKHPLYLPYHQLPERIRFSKEEP